MPNAAEPDPPEVELLFEGDVDEPARVPVVRRDPEASPTLRGSSAPEAAEPSFHTVGADPLGAIAETLSDTLEELRQQRAATRTSDAGGTTPRHDDVVDGVAQVVQATSIPLERVLAYLASVDEVAGLRLSAPHPTVLEGMAVYSGVLRLQRPPTRRRIELRVYPTSSGNLTVLELLPQRNWMPQTKRYLQAGVPAITALTDRIEADCE